MIKLAAFDIDGTLRERSYMPDSTREAIDVLKDRGVILTICTGRSEYEATPIREQLGIDWTISSNGSYIGYRGRMVSGIAFSPALIREWLLYADRAGHALLLYGAQWMYLNRKEAPMLRAAQKRVGGFDHTVMIDSLTTLPDIYQCTVFCEQRELEPYLALAEERPHLHRWLDYAVDMNPHGTNKATGLKKLLDFHGIAPEEATAFGDGLNDMEMMELVGTAIVMGNGNEELKKKATFVTKSLREDGIAHAVHYLKQIRAI